MFHMKTLDTINGILSSRNSFPIYSNFQAINLRNPSTNPKLIGKLKKLKQPKFRVEIPVVDDSPDALSQLAFEVFADIPIKRKGSPKLG
ncbi:hypothetical protein L6164_022485 [Bauhinia variegata]|uniref:Uncharacterized protein n=1 Tax=Bauhinia variegata TaxID=167791 RepID=A0ACB9MF68_BAUVA|nr:hypothetical protein L6164_022485 [Bauhinia variegata]